MLPACRREWDDRRALDAGNGEGTSGDEKGLPGGRMGAHPPGWSWRRRGLAPTRIKGGRSLKCWRDDTSVTVAETVRIGSNPMPVCARRARKVDTAWMMGCAPLRFRGVNAHAASLATVRHTRGSAGRPSCVQHLRIGSCHRHGMPRWPQMYHFCAVTVSPPASASSWRALAPPPAAAANSVKKLDAVSMRYNLYRLYSRSQHLIATTRQWQK